MTNTETVSTERLEQAREAYEMWGNTALEQTPSQVIEYIDALEDALRAASIPAPERSKEETGEAKIEAFVSYGPLRSYDHEKLMDRVLGPALESLEEVRDTRGNLTGWNIVISTLETPPLHKEGEAVGYVSERSFGYLKSGQINGAAMIEPTKTRLATIPLYAAPVPVTITDEMVERLARYNTRRYRPYFPDESPERINRWVDENWRAVADDARAALIAALSLSRKPGEQG